MKNNASTISANILRRLSVRERQTLTYIVSGHTNYEMAAAMRISIKTVEAHRSKLMRKANARNVVDLLRILGLLT